MSIIRKFSPHESKKMIPSRSGRSLRKHMLARAERIKPAAREEVSPAGRKNFELLSSVLQAEEAVKEASRCLLCDEVCSICTTVCPNMALMSYEVTPEKIALQKIFYRDRSFHIKEDDPFLVDQSVQVIHLPEWCNQCGNCTTFCPSAGSPYLDKPHLYLDKASFDATENGYFLQSRQSSPEILGKRMGKEATLLEMEKEYIFSNENFRILIDRPTFRINEYEILSRERSGTDLREAATMKIIMQAAKQLFYEQPA
jgi:putative selenate reductase